MLGFLPILRLEVKVFYELGGSMVTNGELYTNVMDKLRFEPGIDQSNITISIKDNGVVILGGKVKSYAEKCLAEKAVQKLKQVKGIANELEVDLKPDYKRNDDDIVQVALTTLKWAFFVPHQQIKVTLENGHLTLTGDVEYHYQKEYAQEAVQYLYGVTYVTNDIKVKPSVDAVEVKDKITKEFERNARIDANNIQVEVNGSGVTLKGKIRNFDERKEARAAAWAVPGVTNVIDNMVTGC
ncbi:MAG: BON domain-containing protein [Wolbachia endosymbiont of Fragariocoptes setiger]|nr:BON domain-containing protein [Wolbachia endosymbiont of Fragariocoptes setiger]